MPVCWTGIAFGRKLCGGNQFKVADADQGYSNRSGVVFHQTSLFPLYKIANSLKKDKSALFASKINLEMQFKLRFAAPFFDSYLHSKLNKKLNPYLVLMGVVSS